MSERWLCVFCVVWLPFGAGAGGEMAESAKTQYVQKQQRWLLFLRHCAKCRQSEADCQLQAQCKFGKQLWQHILNCTVQACPYPRCTNSKDLLKHHQKCQVRGLMLAYNDHPRGIT